MSRDIIIMQQRMAGWLMYNGMKLLKVKKDLKDKNRNIYIFSDTDELRGLMSKYTNIQNL